MDNLIDNFLTDFLYFVTIGDDKCKELSKEDKLEKSWDKILRVVFKVNKDNFDGEDTLCQKEVEFLNNHIVSLTCHYEQLLLKFFTEKESVLNLKSECRDMRKQLYESGGLNTVTMVYPFDDCKCIGIDHLDIYSVNGTGSGGVVRIHDGNVTVTKEGENYKRTDIIIGIRECKVFIFQADSLVDCELPADLEPLNMSVPLHTAVWNFFHKDFDMEGVQMTKQMIDEHGLQHVIHTYVRECFKIPVMKCAET